MMKYYKYYSKDSVEHLKKKEKKAGERQDSLRKAYKKERKLNKELAKRGIQGDDQYAFADSLQKELQRNKAILNDSSSSDSSKRSARLRIAKIRKDRVTNELAENGHPGKGKFRVADSLKGELRKWWKVMKDTTSSDSLKGVAKEKVKTIVIQHAMLNPKFRGLYENYKEYGQKPDWSTLSKHVPGMDTLKGVFDSSPEQLMNVAENASTQALSKAGGLENFNKQAGEFDQLKKQYGDLSNPETLEAQGKEKAKEQATDHFANQTDKLQGAQQKVNKLLGKYQSFTNADGLTSGVKRTSLEGKSFKERLVIGGNFNIVSTSPLAVDMAPQLGYKFNAKFYVGLSVNYRQTFGDSIKYKWYVSPNNTSLRMFVNYDLIKNFFAYGEAEKTGLKIQSNDTTSKQWVSNYFIGLGKKLLIHPKVYMTITALYNLNNESNNPTYPRRFQMRVGFQLSDLALRKKKINYNP